MTTQHSDPFALAHDLAREFEEILDVKDLASEIDALEGDPARISRLQRSDFMLGEALGMAGLLVSMVSLFLQIRSGNTYQNEPTTKIVERLILKLSEETSLPPDARERLIKKLIKKIIE